MYTYMHNTYCQIFFISSYLRRKEVRQTQINNTAPTESYVEQNATVFKNNHKGDRAFCSILHRRPVRPDSRFLSRSVITIFELNPIIILPSNTNSDTDIHRYRK